MGTGERLPGHLQERGIQSRKSISGAAQEEWWLDDFRPMAVGRHHRGHAAGRAPAFTEPPPKPNGRRGPGRPRKYPLPQPPAPAAAPPAEHGEIRTNLRRPPASNRIMGRVGNVIAPERGQGEMLTGCPLLPKRGDAMKMPASILLRA